MPSELRLFALLVVASLMTLLWLNCLRKLEYTLNLQMLINMVSYLVGGLAGMVIVSLLLYIFCDVSVNIKKWSITAKVNHPQVMWQRTAKGTNYFVSVLEMLEDNDVPLVHTGQHK